MDTRSYKAFLLCMLLVLSSLLLLLGGTGITAAVTIVNSDITGSTNIWTTAGSPYLVNRNITVPSGIVLSIEAGTTVRMAKDTSIFIEGGLDANGTKDQMILFTSQEIVPSGGDWGSLVLNSSASVLMNNCKVEYASAAVNSHSTGHIIIRNSTISSASLHDIVASGGSMPDIINCQFDPGSCTAGDTSIIDVREFFSSHVENSAGASLIFCNITIEDPNGTVEAWQLTNMTGDVIMEEASALHINSTGPHYVPAYTVRASAMQYSYTLKYHANASVSAHRDHLFLFSEEPAMSGLPPSVNDIVEDARYDVPFTLSDPDNSTTDIVIGLNVSQVSVNTSQSCLTFMFRNNSVRGGLLDIVITDGIAVVNYSLPFRVLAVNDAPRITIDGERVINVVEDHEYLVNVTLDDEETPVDHLSVTSDSPYITYNSTLKALHLMYPDGRYTGSRNITVSDGQKNATTNLIIQYQEIPEAPSISSVPLQIGHEDIPWDLDLAPYVSDPDYEDVLSFEPGTDRNTSLCIITMENTTMHFTPVDDMFGSDSFTLTVRDSYDLTASTTISLDILPTNDAPYMSTPVMTPEGGATTDDLITIGIYYMDIDDDAPLYVNLIMGSESYNMSLKNADDGDWTDGDNLFTHSFRVLEPSTISYSFVCSDINGSTFSFGPRTFTVSMARLVHHISMEPVDVSVHYTGYSEMANAFHLSVANSSTHAPPDGKVAQELYFELDLPDTAILWADLLVDYSGLNLSIADESTVSIYSLDTTGWTKLVHTSPDLDTGTVTGNVSGGGSFGLFADIDIHADGDGDGVPYYQDLFPFDPTEWADNDGDGVGDNADMDDDNDGYNDTLEVQAGTDPMNNASIPPDSDGDGLLDIVDPDDDNDGIPDSWELTYGFNPTNPNDSGADPDGDGRSNLEEYRAGSDPNKADASSTNVSWPIILTIVLVTLVLIAGAVMFFAMRRPEPPPEEPVEEELPEAVVHRKKGKNRKKGKKKLVAYAHYDVSGYMARKSSRKSSHVDWDGGDGEEDSNEEEEDLMDEADEAEIDEGEVDEVEEEEDVEEEELELPVDDMLCPECGAEVEEGSMECPSCGAEFESP